MKLKYKLLSKNAFSPSQGTPGSAGWDLYIPKSVQKIHCWRNDIKEIPLDIAFEIPENYFGMLVIRSSLGKLGLTLSNGIGIIDSDYRGPISACIVNVGPQERILMPGDKIVQLIVQPYASVIELEEIKYLSTTIRGTGGWGSTGKDYRNFPGVTYE